MVNFNGLVATKKRYTDKKNAEVKEMDGGRCRKYLQPVTIEAVRLPVEAQLGEWRMDNFHHSQIQ